MSPDAIVSRYLFWIKDKDDKIEATGQRYYEDSCIKAIGLKSDWLRHSIPDQLWENHRPNCQPIHNDNKECKDCAPQMTFRDDGKIPDLKRDNQYFTFYVEIEIDLREDQKVNSNKKIIVRSPYRRIQTRPSFANSPDLKRESGKECSQFSAITNVFKYFREYFKQSDL